MSTRPTRSRPRPSYVSHFQAPNETTQTTEQLSSDSEFELPTETTGLQTAGMKAAESDEDISDGAPEEDGDAVMEDADNSTMNTLQPTSNPSRSAEESGPSQTRPRRKAPAFKVSIAKHVSQGLAAIPRPSKPGLSVAQMSKDHRSRHINIWGPPSSSLRLREEPTHFRASQLTPTTTVAHPVVALRVKKAWAQSLGPGPVWELLEDRAFFKEEWIFGTERISRPLVYQMVNGSDEVLILSSIEAAPYLPNVTSGEIRCFVGQHDTQTLKVLRFLDTCPIARAEANAEAHILNAGGPISSLDWCPLTESALEANSFQQYLAIAPLPNSAHKLQIGVKNPSPATIQLWAYEVDNTVESSANAGKWSCSMVLCFDSGPVIDMKWCPLPSHSEVDQAQVSATSKLGILAAITQDGAFCMFIVPHPRVMEEKGLSFVSLPPKIRISLPDACFQCLDWANSETIALGCTNGYIAVYNVKEVLVDDTVDPIPTHYFPAHQNAVRSISWFRIPPTGGDGGFYIHEDPVLMLSCGHEGIAMLTDIRDCIPRLLVRNREILHSSTFSSVCHVFAVTDVDYCVKTWQVAPAFQARGHNMFGFQGMPLIVHCSDFHPHLAVGSADGCCTTMNLLRSTRREAGVPSWNHKIFQLDYQARTGTYRILDHFLPYEAVGDGASNPIRSSKKSAVQEQTAGDKYQSGNIEGSALWPPEVACTVVRWNHGNGPANAGLLAAGTGSGLVRIDWLTGRWLKGGPPYNGVEDIRFEGQNLEGEGSGSD